MKYLLAFSVLVMFSSCSVMVDKIDTKKFDGKISYFKDEKTGLCFAAVVINKIDGLSFTCVPCEKIQAELK